MDCSMPGLSVPHHLLKFAQVHVHCIGDAIQPSHPLTPSSPSALNLCQHQGLFQWINCLHQMTQILEFQLQHRSFQWVFRVDFPQDWLVRSCCLRTARDSQESSPTPQLEGINSLALPFFTIQLSQPYVATGKIIALTIQTFVSRVMSLLFNTLSRFVTPFLPRSKCLLMSWLTVTTCSDFRAQEEEICHYFHLFPLYLPGSNGARCHDFHLIVLSQPFHSPPHPHQEAL